MYESNIGGPCATCHHWRHFIRRSIDDDVMIRRHLCDSLIVPKFTESNFKHDSMARYHAWYLWIQQGYDRQRLHQYDVVRGPMLLKLPFWSVGRLRPLHLWNDGKDTVIREWSAPSEVGGFNTRAHGKRVQCVPNQVLHVLLPNNVKPVATMWHIRGCPLFGPLALHPTATSKNWLHVHTCALTIRFWVLFQLGLLSFNQSLFWITYSPISSNAMAYYDVPSNTITW